MNSRPPGEAAPDSAEDTPAYPVVGVAELSALLRSAQPGSARPPVILDVRWRLGGPPGIESYLDGHLPGAGFIDLDKDLSGQAGLAGRHPLPDPAVFQVAMRTAGLHAGQLAVAYDDGDSTVAARLWWMLRYYGHRQAAVLNGGFRAWATAGLPLSRVVKRPEPGDFVVTTVGDMPVLSDAQAGELARSGILLDARAGARYRGEVEPVDRVGGHIPGAISAPTKDNVAPDGLFLDPAELTRRFDSLGVPDPTTRPGDGQPSAPVIGAYCGSGVTAAHQVLALELTGRPAALYVGSWSAWSASRSRPVATGPDPG